MTAPTPIQGAQPIRPLGDTAASPKDQMIQSAKDILAGKTDAKLDADKATAIQRLLIE